MLPDFPRRNTGDFCLSIHPSPVRPMCRYIIPRMLPSGHKLHTISEYYWNCNKIETNSSLCSASSTRLSTWHCPHLLLSAVLRPRAASLLLPGARRCRSISFARTALSSKPAARRCCVRLMEQTDWLTDGRTDTGPFYRPCSAYCARSVKKRVRLSNRRCSASLNFLLRYWVH